MWSSMSWAIAWLDEKLDGVLNPRVEGFKQANGVLGVLFLAITMVSLGSLWLWWEGKETPRPAYYLVQEGSQPTRLPTLSTPSLSAVKVQNWTARALRETFSMGFNTLDQDLQEGQLFFTPETWDRFLQGIEKTQMLEQVRTNRLLVVLSTLEQPSITSVRRLANGQALWTVEVPVVITLLGGETPVHNSYWISVAVRSVPTTEDPEALAIAEIRTQSYRR